MSPGGRLTVLPEPWLLRFWLKQRSIFTSPHWPYSPTLAATHASPAAAQRLKMEKQGAQRVGSQPATARLGAPCRSGGDTTAGSYQPGTCVSAARDRSVHGALHPGVVLYLLRPAVGETHYPRGSINRNLFGLFQRVYQSSQIPDHILPIGSADQLLARLRPAHRVGFTRAADSVLIRRPVPQRPSH